MDRSPILNLAHAYKMESHQQETVTQANSRKSLVTSIQGRLSENLSKNLFPDVASPPSTESPSFTSNQNQLPGRNKVILPGHDDCNAS